MPRQIDLSSMAFDPNDDSNDLMLRYFAARLALEDIAVAAGFDTNAIVKEGQHKRRAKGESMARSRYQKGTVLLRGKRRKVWILRWRDDIEQADGTRRRVERKTLLGTQSELATKKLALRRAELVLARVNSPNYRAIKTITFDAFVELWRPRSLALRKPYTQKSANYHLRVHLLPHFARKRLDEIGTEQVQQLVSEMAAKVKRHTIMNVLGTLNTILKTARSWGYLTGEFAATNLTIPNEHVRSAVRFFTAEHARRIIEGAEQPWKCLFATAAMTGLRPGEVLGLCIEDIDLEQRIIHVRRTACFGKLVTPKTRSSMATVPMPGPLVEILTEYLAVAWTPNAAKLLFATRSGRPHATNKINEYRLLPLCKRLGIPPCSFKGFRHTMSSLLVSQGASPVVAQRQLRHSDPMTTLRNYTHIVGSEQRDAVEKVAGILRPTSATKTDDQQ